MTETTLTGTESQTQQIDAINQEAKRLRHLQPDQATRLYEQARRLATSGDFSSEPYKIGLAASLAGLARLNMEIKPDKSVDFCLQALSLLEGAPACEPLVDANNTMGWIYFHLGDYSNAMQWVLQALGHSQDLGLTSQEAAAFDLIANIYGNTEEFPQAIRAHMSALQLSRALHNQEQEASYLNNLAMTQMAMGDYTTALESGQAGLRMFITLNINLSIANTYDTLAQIHLKMGDLQQAESSLRSGLNIIENADTQLLKSYLIKGLGRVFLAQGNLTDALEYTQRALAIDQQNGFRKELAECHELFSMIFEQKADFPSALKHFKEFHEISKELTGDAVQNRLAILNVLHEVEKTNREAEIVRSRNIQLQAEIAERKRIQTALVELATSDPLTGLFNRRHYIEESNHVFEQMVTFEQPLAVMMLDLDNFKSINDTYGHPVGDLVLTEVGRRIKMIVRESDIAGRMGGEEFSLFLPNTGVEGAVQAAERLCRSFACQGIPYGDHAIHLTASIGLTCFSPAHAGSPSSFDTILIEADKALYQAKNKGRNQVCLYKAK
jgi:diguanylate cyclase (GGDEF)-like protein